MLSKLLFQFFFEFLSAKKKKKKMDEQQKLNLIEQFTNVTGNPDQARSFLESANWNLEVYKT